ncbi:MAG: alpha/beta hydrolase [Burkholderiaceae bacterium]
MAISDLTPQAITLDSGVVIHYVREGTGPTVIFIHGAMGDWRSWEKQWPAFTADHDCLAVSCRFSFPNPNTMASPDHSALDDATDVEGLMDALGIERAILIGSSYGGFASLALALRRPERVRAVVAVEPPMMKYAQMFPDTAPVAARFHAATVVPSREAFERGDDQTGATLLTGGIANQDPASLDPTVMARRRQNILAARRIALSSDEFPLLDPAGLAALPMPVLLLTGRNTGPIFKAIISGITRVMTKARLETVDGAGHGVSIEQPEAFNTLVRGFLASSVGTRETGKEPPRGS